ncbi:MAG: M60 family metallopeptidase [Phycisphaeraceae bacterium]
MRKLFTTSLLLALAAGPALASETDLINALGALQGHVNGSAPLSPAQIEANKLTLDANKNLFGNSAATINAGFNYVQAYEAAYGPMWGAGTPTQNGFSRSSTSNQDIHWTTFNAMQYIVDDTYNTATLNTFGATLDGLKFNSGDVVPGPVNTTLNPSGNYSVSIDASFLNTFGRNTMHWAEPDRNAMNATGAYLVPGEIATINVPAALVNSGYKIRVGGQHWDLSNKNPVDRLDRVSLTYDITSTSMQIANPVGGSIYIETPFEADNGVVQIDMQNVSRAPFFSMQDHHETTLTQWQTTERNWAAPWTDLQSEKFMMTVPTGWVYALDDPKTLMENWDKAMDVTNDLMGFPRDRGKVTLYEAVDVRIRSGAYAPGYPTVNTTYDPLRNQDASGWNTAGNADNGESGNHLIQGPHIRGSHVLFHELGHAYLFPKLPGEVEAIVNFLHVPVFNVAFGYSMDEAFRGSRGFSDPYMTMDTTAINWMTSFNFFYFKKPMDKLEKQYQMKGHAKFVEVANLFGWEPIGDYYQSYNAVDDVQGGRYNTGIDGHLLALSTAIGEDITPLFHFYGVHPEDLATLQADLDAAGVVKSRKVFQRLREFRDLVPDDNAEFRNHASEWWETATRFRSSYNGQPSIDGYWTEHEHARQWDATDLSNEEYGEGFFRSTDLPNGEMYTEDTAAMIRGVIDELIHLYYLEFLADLNEDDAVDLADWQIFIANVQADMSGLTADQAWAMGDLDGDFDNDLNDFDLFRRAYEEANPAPGAFAAMLAEASVPEPGTAALIGAGAVLGLRRRRRAAYDSIVTGESDPTSE